MAMTWAWKAVRRLPDFLDWLLAVVERSLALGIALVVFWVGFRLASGKATPNERDTIFKLGENWKAAFFLLIPLFYKTVRVFLEEVRGAFGMKRQPQAGVVEEPEESRPTGERS